MASRSKFVLVSLLVIAVDSCAALQRGKWSATTYPNPYTRDGALACRGRETLGTLCDPDTILSTESCNVVEGVMKAIGNAQKPYAHNQCSKQTDLPGFQVAVALMDSMVGAAKDPSKTALEFAAELFDKWGVGEANCGNGVLLLLSRFDRQVYIMTGKEALKYAPETKLKLVVDRMTPKLKVGKYDEAVEQAVVDLGVLLAQGDIHGHPKSGDDPEAGDDPEVGDSSEAWLFVCLIGFVALGIALFKRSHNRSKNERERCKSLLEKLKREQESVLSTGKYPAASCPICYEDLQPQPAPSAPPLPSASQEAAKKVDDADETAVPLLSKEKPRDQKAASEASSSHVSATCLGRQKPFVLPCGHTFCKSCISKWLATNATCPVCRKELGSSSDAPQRPATVRPADAALYEQELGFRMMQLQRMYPDIITADMVSHAADSMARGSRLDWESVASQQLQPGSRNDYMNSGISGSSHGFGGGCHSGGGGVGGSW